MASNVVPWTSKKRKLTASKDEPSSGALQRHVVRLFNEFLASSLVPEVLSEPLAQFGDRLIGFSPAINVLKTEQELLVSVEVPGMDERDIELSLTKEGLTIRGERKPVWVENTEDAFTYLESQFGMFERVVPLTDIVVDEDRVEATASKGVVTISLPFKASSVSSPRKVSIRPT
jgi:HSP20 family protein